MHIKVACGCFSEKSNVVKSIEIAVIQSAFDFIFQKDGRNHLYFASSDRFILRQCDRCASTV